MSHKPAIKAVSKRLGHAVMERNDRMKTMRHLAERGQEDTGSYRRAAAKGQELSREIASLMASIGALEVLDRAAVGYENPVEEIPPYAVAAALGKQYEALGADTPSQYRSGYREAVHDLTGIAEVMSAITSN